MRPYPRQVETGIPADRMLLLHDGRRLTDDKRRLSDVGIKENDVLLVEGLQAPAEAGTPDQNTGTDHGTA